MLFKLFENSPKLGDEIVELSLPGCGVVSVELEVQLRAGVLDHGVENVHKKDKQEGGEGAALFDSGVEENLFRRGTLEIRKAVGVREQPFDSVNVGLGEAHRFEELKEGRVVTRVESFSEVKKEHGVRLVLLESFVKRLVEVL